MIALTVSGGATPSDTSNTLNVRGAQAIMLEVDHNQVGSASTTMTASIFTSEDDSVWDNLAYVSLNLGAAQVKSIPVTVGMKYLRVYLLNNDAANATKVLPRVIVTY
jgi:hypothetical protein